MSDFRRLDDHDLDRLGDEDLVDYVNQARAAGQPEAGRRAMEIVSWRQEPLIKARVTAKMPPSAREDVIMECLESFVRSAFDGKVIGSVRAFASTIASRRIADYYRARERDPEQVPLPVEHEGEEEIWGEGPGVDDPTATVAIEDAVERVLATRNETHKRMIMLYAPGLMGGDDLSGAQVVEQMVAEHGEAVSIDNVQQVWRRFKVDLEKELQAGEDGLSPDG